MRIVELNENTKKNLLEDLLKRSPNQYTQYEETVAAIVADVRERRDMALLEYTEKFDHVQINAENIRVTEEEFARRREGWTPVRKPRMTALAKYAALVTGADTGAVADRNRLD